MFLDSLPTVSTFYSWFDLLIDLIVVWIAFLTNRHYWHMVTREKGRDLTKAYDKNPIIHRKIKKAMCQHKNATTNFDNKTIADRLRMVSFSNDSYPTGGVKLANGVQSKGHTSKNL